MDQPELNALEREAARELRNRLLPHARQLLEALRATEELRTSQEAWLAYWACDHARDLAGLHIASARDGAWRSWVVLTTGETLAVGAATPSQEYALADAIEALAVALLANERRWAQFEELAIMQVDELRFALPTGARDTGATLAQTLGFEDATAAELTALRYIGHKFPRGISQGAYEDLSEDDRTLFHGVLALCLAFGVQTLATPSGTGGNLALH
jgi:hypothetical protein